MGFFKKLIGKREKVVVIALDGVPYSMCRKLYMKGIFQHLGGDGYVPLSSVYPTISSVAWSTFMTGKNPGKHNIFGFVDRLPGSDELHIPDSSHLKEKTLWKYLSEHKKRCFVMNVPMTYPPENVEGKLVSGFLCGDLMKGTYPRKFAGELKRMGYRIDADSSLAAESMDGFLQDIHRTFEARKRALFKYLKEDWDFFMVQFMETDRINHFLIGDWAEDGEYADEFVEFYSKVDSMVGELISSVDEDTHVILMSDHGFTPIIKEVQLNSWLKKKGFLEDVDGYDSIGAGTKAFSLLPGRVYVNLEGREHGGGVRDRESVINKLMDELKGLKDPETGRDVVQSVFRREEIYYGMYAKKAADIIVHPSRGYDLKASFKSEQIFGCSARTGMHTYKDAFLYSSAEIELVDPNIIDLFPTILKLLGVDVPDVDGSSLL